MKHASFLDNAFTFQKLRNQCFRFVYIHLGHKAHGPAIDGKERRRKTIEFTYGTKNCSISTDHHEQIDITRFFKGLDVGSRGKALSTTLIDEHLHARFFEQRQNIACHLIAMMKVAFDGEAGRDQDAWSVRRGEMDLRLRLAGRIPLVTEELRSTRPGGRGCSQS